MALQPGVTGKQIKMRFYQLAKEAHPDVIQGTAAQQQPGQGPKVESYAEGVPLLAEQVDPVARFLEIQSAYELLMEAAENGGMPPGTGRKKPPAQPKARAKTLGEVLCDRLRDEPEEIDSVWEDIKAQKLSVSHLMIEQMFKALALKGKTASAPHANMPAGLALLHEGEQLGLISQPVRSGAMVILLTGWKHADEDYIVDVVVEHVTDADRESTAVIAAIGSVFCSGTRSPY